MDDETDFDMINQTVVWNGDGTVSPINNIKDPPKK